VDEGVAKCLDTLQEKGGVNVLMPTVFTYGRGLSGRQVPGQPLPDHGVQEYDQIHGGAMRKFTLSFTQAPWSGIFARRNWVISIFWRT
jgi:hypothetical protein